MPSPDPHEQESAPGSTITSFALKDLVTAVDQNKLTILLAVITGMLGAYFLSRVIPIRYAAEAILVAASPSSRVVDLRTEEPQLVVDPLAIRTIVETIGSTMIIERAIQSLAPDIREALTKATSQEKKSYIPFCPAAFCEVLAPADNRSPGDGAEIEGSHDMRPITKYVGRGLSVSNGGRSYIIQVRYMAPDPRTSASIANAVVTEYLAYRSDQKQQAYVQTATALGNKLASLKFELQAAERTAQAMREQVRLQELRSGVLTGSKREEAISENAEAYAKQREAEREAQAIASVYELFLLRLRELEGRQDFPETDIRLLSPARVPLEPSGLNPSILVGLGALAGFLAGASGVTIKSRRKRARAHE